MKPSATGRESIAADHRAKRGRALRCAGAALPAALLAGAAAAALVAAGAADPAPAAALWLAVAIGAAAGLWPVAAAVDAASALAARLAAGQGAGPAPRPALSGLAAPLHRALARLDREWRARRERTAGAIARHEAILDALRDPLLLLDDSRVVVFANRAAGAAFGTGLVGRPLAAAVRAPAILAAAERVADGAVSARFEVGAESEGGRVYMGRVQPIAGADDGPRVALTLRDVTEQERSERLRAEFVANASHEIRTPLTAVVGAIETLRGPARDDAATRETFLAMMADHAARIGRLVDDLLSLSRIERSEAQTPDDEVALRPAVDRAVEALAWRARERGVRIVVRVPETLPAALGDAEEIALAVQNLIDNAIKYGAADSTVTVEAKADAEAVAVAVSDEGPGIAAEHLPRLTERFYRVDKARSNRVGGTGLGLAIVKHVARRHRGALDIASAPGEGSRFAIRLRRADVTGPDGAGAGDTKS